MKDEVIAYLTLALSTAVHVPLLFSESKPETPARQAPAFLELAPLPPPPPPKVEETKEPAEVEPPPAAKKPKPVAERPDAEPPLPDEPAAEPPLVAEVAPAELTGTTLVSDVGASWSAPGGNGAGRNGAIGAGVASKAKKQVSPGVQPKAIASLPVVPLAELSRKPKPPPLQRVLERHYPTRARNQGQGGEAKVRARIEASGKVREVTVTFETGHGFGAACRAALLESQWSAPLDARGKAVATWITYRCKFRVDE
jgi:TonB family protein